MFRGKSSHKNKIKRERVDSSVNCTYGVPSKKFLCLFDHAQIVFTNDFHKEQAFSLSTIYLICYSVYIIF